MKSALPRVLEPEVMDAPDEARDYDAMDHSGVNRQFIDDFLAAWHDGGRPLEGEILDVGAGTAQIPIMLCQTDPRATVLAIDLALSMLELAERNVRAAGLSQRIRLERVDAKRLPWTAGSFAAVISNSIVHHIPEPSEVLAEVARVTAPRGLIFVRDLLRPANDTTVQQLVETYAGQENAHQRAMFEASLRAALSLDEIRALVVARGFESNSVTATSDRHWTWCAHTL